MSWSRRRHGREAYHHGNLREALIEAALALIADHGAEGFTFAEAARQAGVSPAAPYRHFRDREQLLAEVAVQGFGRFETSLTAAWNKGAPDPVTALCNLGRAYLEFARTQPGYYNAMFEAGIPPTASLELREAGDRAFGVLRSAAEAVIAKLPPDGRPPSLMAALHIWSMAHGIASLFGERQAGKRSMPMSPDDLLEAGTLVYLRGLGLTP